MDDARDDAMQAGSDEAFQTRPDEQAHPPAREPRVRKAVVQLEPPPPRAYACIVVRGLDYRANASDLVDFFREGGIELQQTPLVTYTAQGIAYVPLDSDAAVESALKRHKAYMGRRYVATRHSTLQSIAHNAAAVRAGSQLGTPLPSPAYSLDACRYLEVERASASDYSTAYNEIAPVDAEDVTVVRVRGLPFSCTRTALATVFGQYPLAPVSPQGADLTIPTAGLEGVGSGRKLTHAVYIMPHVESGRVSGDGYVLLASKADAEAACAGLQGVTMPSLTTSGGNRALELTVVPKGEIYTHLDLMEMRGLSSDGDCACIVRIRNFDFDLSRGQVHEALDSLGITNSVGAQYLTYLPRKPDNRFSGEAVIEFGSEQAASAAAALFADGAVTISGRVVEARVGLKCELYGVMGGAHIARADGDVLSAVHIKELPFTAGPGELLSFLSKHSDVSVGEENVYIIQRLDAKPAGEAYVLCSEQAQAEALAKDVQGRTMNSRTIAASAVRRQELFDAISRPPLRLAQGIAHGGRGDREGGKGSGMFVAGWLDGFTVSREQLDTCLRCRGVPYECQEGDLRRFFGPAFEPSIIAVHLLQEDGRTYGKWPLLLSLCVFSLCALLTSCLLPCRGLCGVQLTCCSPVCAGQAACHHASPALTERQRQGQVY